MSPAGLGSVGGEDTGNRKMMKIVFDAGYRGFVGIEYEGLGEFEGIWATKALLERVRGGWSRGFEPRPSC